MSIQYRNRYRIPSARLAGWDYRRTGTYAVTICTRHRDCCLGEVVGDRVVLSPIGEIVSQEWLRIPRLRPSVTLDTWVIMPDHLHGILLLAAPPAPAQVTEAEDRSKACSLGSVVGQFKKNCTTRIWAKHRRDFAWQSRFYDQILRDSEALQAMRTYIQENPLRWLNRGETSAFQEEIGRRLASGPATPMEFSGLKKKIREELEVRKGGRP